MRVSRRNLYGVPIITKDADREQVALLEFAERYSRQILFQPVGPEGQKKLAAARVAIVGCGATGSALASLLARAGLGYMRIIDRDYVEPSNLQRQVLFDESDAAESLPKAIAAARKISGFNSEIVVEPHAADLVPGNVHDLLANVELILDGTDNFETRYLINDFAVSEKLPWIYAAGVGSYAVTMTVLPEETACLACIFPDSPKGIVETCDTSGILNSAVNLVASIAATEAMKLIVGARDQIRRTLLVVRRVDQRAAEVSTARPREDCRACQQHDFVHLAGEGRPPISLCGRNSVQIHERQRPIDFEEITRRLAPHGAGKAQRVRAQVLARPLRDDALPRWPRHHQRHDGHRHCQKLVCEVCGVVVSSPASRPFFCC